MNYQIIILIVLSAIVIYFSIAELVWQFRNRHFRRRLIIGVLITALLVSQIDFVNFFTKTDAEQVSAMSADAPTVETALAELMQSDTWQAVRTLAGIDTASPEETEVDEHTLDEERPGDTEREILSETENDTEEGDPAETAGTDEENSAETEKGPEERDSAETGTDEENLAEKENDTEESLRQDSMENSMDSEKSLDRAESAADTKTEIQAETASGDGITVSSVDDVMQLANTDNDDHDNIQWTSWEKTDSLPSGTGNYYLMDNVTLSSTWEVQGAVNLCMNGKTFTGSVSNLIHVNANATLNIYDCKGEGSHKTYTITYYPGEFGTGTVESQIKAHGKPVTLSTNTFSRTGYKQTGWAESDGGALKYELGGTYTDDHDLTLYPTWEADTYQVTYEKNDGTIADENNYTSYTYGVGLKLPTPSREGYVFEGWYEDSAFSGAKVTEITATDTGDKIFYAKWSEIVYTYTITYKPGKYGEGDETTQTKIQNSAIDLLPAIFTRLGYVQTGWAESDGGALKYELEESYTVDKEITLYPVWTVVYTITYDHGEYGTGTIDEQMKIHGIAVNLSTDTFTRPGYIQTGWAENDGGALKYELGGTYTDDQNITFYPVWTATYRVTYVKNGGTIKDESNYTSYTYGEGLKLPTPVRAGYMFMGWYTDQNFKGSVVSSISTTAEGEKTFYAKWTVVSTEGNDNDDSHDNSDDEGFSSDNGDGGSGNTGNTQPGTNDPAEPDEDDTDETDEDTEDELSPEDTDDSTDKEKEEKKEKDITDTSDEQTESDADNDKGSSEESKKSTERAGIQPANRSVQAKLENGEIVISGNPDGTDGTGTDGNGAGGEMVTVLTVEEGSIIVTIDSDEWQYGAGVTDTVTVVNTILTSEQKLLVSDGANIEIRLVVKDISEQVSEEDKGIIEDGLKADRKEESAELVPVAYIDISVYIRIGNEDWKAITRTDRPIEVVVGISEEWSDGRALYIARSHESEYALLEDLDSESDTVTIMTDVFSTYAIVHQQMPAITSVITTKANRIYDYFSSHSWTTATWIGIALLCICILEILRIIVILLFWKQYKKDKDKNSNLSQGFTG